MVMTEAGGQAQPHDRLWTDHIPEYSLAKASHVAKANITGLKKYTLPRKTAKIHDKGYGDIGRNAKERKIIQ